ncbi:uncharacterized protein LOC115433741 [Sphaeramia orbicularis]|uniref:uncharacterized protein LOC115433741 n=1 Tax=Sphaeramia orbicularis TaxID=375764 RepID=UPI00117C609E|nr:(E2-independent) E3 ubiquitin-conjugating enzyme FATS [Sphaeramia orbicularis]
MSVVFHSRRFSSQSTPNINEASSKDVAASLHKNVLSWAVWRGHEEKRSVSFRAVTPSAISQAAGSFPCSGVSNLFRAASVPDVVGRSPNTLSSITITTQKVTSTGSTSLRPVDLSSLKPPTKVSTPEPFGTRDFSNSTCAMRMTNSKSDKRAQTPTISKPNEFRQSYSPSDRLATIDPGRRKVQLVQRRQSHTVGDTNLHVMDGSLMRLPSETSQCSRIHLDVPLRSVTSVVFLDKSLCISLADLEKRRVGRPSLYRSALSLRLGVSSRQKSSTDNKPTKTNDGCKRPRAAMLAGNKCSGRDSGFGHYRGLQSKQWGRKVEQIAPTYGVNSETHDSDTQRHCAALGLLSFRGPSTSNIKACRQKGNADEAAYPTHSNFKQRQHTLNIGPVDSRTWDKQVKSNEKEEQAEPGAELNKKSPSVNTDKSCYYHSRLKADSLEETAKALSLKEALELFRPDFISRSQSRVKRLEQRARRRRALQGSNPDLVQGLREDQCKQKRNCTTPDPLSDNLFKPRERSISGREMQLRSRRIYNKLPEVTKKKEEEKKRAVSQTNRLRAEVFKKKLLDQILQR